MTYAKWKEEKLSIADLCLDTSNPRMSTTNLAERDLIAEYIKNYKVFELAKSIADNGYFLNERLIIITDGEKNIVVEGNRRLAALKALVENNVVPEEYKERFKKLPHIDVNITKNIPVIIAPTRQDANQLIIHRHTETPFLGWEPAIQARFYHNLIEQGMNIDNIASTYHLPCGLITDFIKTYDMYMIAKGLNLPKEIQETVKDEQTFPISTLMNRIVGSPKVRKFLGIEFNEDGRVIGKIVKEEFEKGYTKIITDLAIGNIDSRSEKLKAKKIGTYLKEFGNNTPDTTLKGSFDRNSFTGEKTEVHQFQIKTKRRKSRRRPKSLIPDGIVFNLNNTSLQNIYVELRHKIIVKNTPHATAILFRSFLQMSMTQYLKENKLLNNVKKNDPKRQPTLDEMLIYFISPESPITDNAIKQAIQKSKSDREKIFSIDTMNAITHNEQISITEDKVRTLWANFEGFMKFLLSGGKD